ncbi:NADP-specific glutamate dehydrogenase [Aquibacillus koreensis]|uniref:Glutamate dehydrogenase n=1 Tax=Aquibacillus koreensis TaxID=279446 RepID=A0A9X3WLK0_9BACI|nr:NADP-specific glutamate dehydrogenase [Aquibacillus koreensis]MCT2535204.1 NADP-specific glutamate dehydrogenase [Aquibacillus koreensis]MDC3421063.1 NADP-specific glutamate dehydrogenase [Aquibacillus koreensis]
MDKVKGIDPIDVQCYVNQIIAKVEFLNPNEPEFLQAVKEVIRSIIPVLVKNPIYLKQAVLDKLVEPERMILFMVPWVDDEGNTKVNRGFRVQYNSAIGPYKGGLRFHPSVNGSVLKFLGFQQVIKNALTSQPIGGGTGGSDFDPEGKSDAEILRFCQSFMAELSRHIGPYKDVPSGDIGVGTREIRYLFSEYKKIRGTYEASVLTVKAVGYGGSFGRKEATGYGIVYFVEEMLKNRRMSFNKKTVVVSGSGNVAIYAMEKAIELGAIVVACSDSSGYIYDPRGLKLDTITRLKEFENKKISDYVLAHPEAIFVEGSTGIWSIPCDIALPCATQNEINSVAASQLISNGVKAIGEGANMPSTIAAIDLFLENNVLIAPYKAANAGGVSVTALEMAKHSKSLVWKREEVDSKLQEIMKDIYQTCKETSEAYDCPGNLMVGANIAGFLKVADAMIARKVSTG